MAETSLAVKCFAEFIGTFLLVFTVGCNVLSHNPAFAGVSIACVLMVAIYALGGVSGANFNPAVSVTLAITKSMKGPGLDWQTCGMYCLVQVLAGIVGAFTYAILFWEAFNLQPSKGFNGLSVGLCETLYTFMLCFVVLNVAAAKKYSEEGGNEWYGLAIGFVIIAGAYGAGAVSGGCFNPAVAIGVDTSSAGLGFGWCLAYTVFELIGAALAAVAFRVVRPGDFDPMREKGLSAVLTSEFLGTFMLVLTVGLNVLAGSPSGAFSIAASLMCMIYALGDVSGAHFNPAVTLAIRASGMDSTLTNKMTGLYMLVQVLGGVVAAFVYALIYAGKTFPLGPLPGHTWSQVAVAETIFTFLLCFVVLAVAVSTKTHSTDMFGLAIGSCVTVGGFAIGSISGGSLNPAVSIGIASSQILNGGMFYKALFYSAFEFVGAGAAAAVVMATHGKDDK
jgi:aquaporin Z